MVPTPKKDPGVCVLVLVGIAPELSVAVGSVQTTVVPVLPVVVVAVTSLMQLTVGATVSADGGNKNVIAKKMLIFCTFSSFVLKTFIKLLTRLC